jgi:hypothetical protein
MIEKIDRFNGIPDSALSDITDKPTVAPESVIASDIVDDSTLIGTREHIQTGNINPNLGTANSPNTANTATSPVTAPVKLGDAIQGRRAVDVFDAIFPSLAALLISYLGYEFSKKSLQLDADEKKTLAPVMQEFLNSINVNMNNPLNNLLIVLGAIYAGKVIDVMPELKRKTVIKKLPQSSSNNKAVPTEKPDVKSDPVKAYEAEAEALINATRAKRKKSRQAVIDFLNQTGEFRKLKQKHGLLKQAA